MKEDGDEGGWREIKEAAPEDNQLIFNLYFTNKRDIQGLPGCTGALCGMSKCKSARSLQVIKADHNFQAKRAAVQ